MAGSPMFKVYVDGEYVASCKRPIHAAAIIAASGRGQIRYGHGRVMWREGYEECPAAESYDFVHETVMKRLRNA